MLGSERKLVLQDTLEAMQNLDCKTEEMVKHFKRVHKVSQSESLSSFFKQVFQGKRYTHTETEVIGAVQKAFDAVDEMIDGCPSNQYCQRFEALLNEIFHMERFSMTSGNTTNMLDQRYALIGGILATGTDFLQDVHYVETGAFHKDLSTIAKKSL